MATAAARVVQHAGGDLPLGVPDAVAEFGGSRRQVVGPVGQQRHVGFRAMLGGRGAVLRMDGDAAAFQPFVAVGFRLAPAAGEGLLDKIEALIQPVAADHAVVRERPDAVHGIVRLDHVLATDREWVDAQLAAQLVDGGLDRERGLRRAISPEGARGHRIRVDRVAGPLLVGAAIGGHRGAERRGQDLAAVIAVGPGVRDGVDLHRRERAVLLRPQLDRDLHRMAGDRRGELLGAGEFPLHRASGLERRQDAQVLGEHLLLAAEPAPDEFGEDVDLVADTSGTGTRA